MNKLNELEYLYDNLIIDINLPNNWAISYTKKTKILVLQKDLNIFYKSLFITQTLDGMRIEIFDNYGTRSETSILKVIETSKLDYIRCLFYNFINYINKEDEVIELKENLNKLSILSQYESIVRNFTRDFKIKNIIKNE